MSPQEPWLLAETRGHISLLKLSVARTSEASQLLDSLAKYIDIFRYHVSNAQEKIKPHSRQAGGVTADEIKKILGIHEEQAGFKHDCIACQAHLIASIHTVRNLYELFSQLVNITVLEERIDKGDCDLIKVANAPPDSQLKQNINTLLSSDAFDYIRAFSNKVKHQDLIKMPTRIDTNLGVFGLYVCPFEYKGKKYSGRWVEDLCQDTVNIQNIVLDFGSSLNIVLEKAPIAQKR